MRCLFGRPHPPRHRQNYTFGVAPGFVDYVEAEEEREDDAYWAYYRAFLEKHPTCWKRFLHWLHPCCKED